MGLVRQVARESALLLGLVDLSLAVEIHGAGAQEFVKRCQRQRLLHRANGRRAPRSSNTSSEMELITRMLRAEAPAMTACSWPSCVTTVICADDDDKLALIVA